MDVTPAVKNLKMVPANTEFAELLRKAKAGDLAALDQLARTYERDLRIAARFHLGPAMRPYLDSIDLVQSVHRSIFRGLRADNFNLDNPTSLIALAMTMVRRKVARHWRRHRRQLRIEGQLPANEPLHEVLSTLAMPTTDPLNSLAAREAIANLIAQLEPADRSFLELRLQGWNTAEAATQLGQTPEALRIRLFRLRKRLQDDGLSADWL